MQAQGRIALVTGANRGIGLEVSRQLAQQGATVIMASRDPDKGRQAAESLRQEGLAVHDQVLDVSEAGQIDAVAGFIRERFGRLDILINNAGVFLDGMPGVSYPSALEVDIGILRRTMEVNLYGPLRLCQAFVPWMRKQNYGRIVNLSSGMGQLSEMNGCCPAYRTSKTALNALTRLLADELRETNVAINSVCPGWVRTDMGGPEATRNVAEGADTIVWLATQPDNGPSGGFFRDRQTIPW
jgi:NAD(P)-dependent dehydrogenase (short-subunit alcohol dehydrogenase family)